MDNGTLLIVEDNQILREGIKHILSTEGYQVHTSPDGEDALQQMKYIIPDLIMSDISMPRMDGYAFFQAVRAKPEWVTIPFVFLTARGSRDDVLVGKDLGAEDYLVKPLSRAEILTAVKARLARSQEIRVAQLRRAYETSLTMLANAIDVRDPYTRGHVERVTDYSQLLARGLGLKSVVLKHLRFGAILHDIGKIMIRETTLFKTGPLTDEEWDEIKVHPVVGSEMIKDITYLTPAIPIIRHHHERWDGTGYPDGLAGEDIPLTARIVSVSDGFDAMTTDRSYQEARTLEGAYEEILCCAGSQYDPSVVGAFQKAWEKGQIQQIRHAWDAGQT
jgi:putative two-component system response regulator